MALAHGLLTCFAALLLVGHAAIAKPAISINTPAVEITVTIDEAFKAHPGLAADCLAEGRRWAEKARKEADETRRKEPDLFSEGRKWTFERDYTSRSLVGRYVGVLRSDYASTGGAHPNSYLDTILWDRDAQRRVSIRPLLKETADNGPTMRALTKLVRIAVATEKIARGAVDEDPGKTVSPASYAQEDQFIVDGVQPTLLKLGPVTLAPSTVADKSSGLTFHFSPYAVGPYAEGAYTVFVPWTELKPYLSAQGTTIFAGERPEGDDKQ
jgi:hypothetical protein